MAHRRRPVAVIMAAVLCALVAGAALAGAALLREHRVSTASQARDVPSAGSLSRVSTPGGCQAGPCRVVATVPVAGTTVELVADHGGRSGRLRIGGPGTSEVIEVTVTELGVTLTRASLQCVARAMSACIVRGKYADGVAGQVVVGRSGNWSSLGKPFVSGAGYLALADVTPAQSGLEVVAAQHECDRATAAECAGAPVFAQVFAVSTGTEVGCTRTYPALDSLPGYPEVTLTRDDLSEC